MATSAKKDDMDQLLRSVVYHKPFEVTDSRATFVSSIKISAKELYEQLFDQAEDQNLRCDTVNFSLSNTKISISSLVTLSPPEMDVMVKTNESISFGVDQESFKDIMESMAMGPEEHPEILLAYLPNEKRLILKDDQSETCFETVPCAPEKRNTYNQCVQANNLCESLVDALSKVLN